MTKLIVAFSNFAKAPKNYNHTYSVYVHTHVRTDISTYTHVYAVSNEFVECDVQNTENYISCEWWQNKWKTGKKKNVSTKSYPHKRTTSLHPFYV